MLLPVTLISMYLSLFTLACAVIPTNARSYYLLFVKGIFQRNKILLLFKLLVFKIEET